MLSCKPGHAPKHLLSFFLLCALLFSFWPAASGQTLARNENVLSPLERRLKDRVRHEFGLKNQSLPEIDSRLVLAARRKAESLLEASPKQLDHESHADLHAWIRAFGASDYQLKSSFILGDTPETLVEKLGEWASGIVGEKPWSHFGAGTARWQGKHCAVVFVVWRPVRVKSLPSVLERPGKVRIEGRVPFDLKGLRLHLTDPRHRSRVFHPRLTAGGFAETLPFDSLGEWTLEILVDTERGPTVVALMPVRVGPKTARKPIPALKEPPTPDDSSATQALLQWTQSLRRSFTLPELKPSPLLQKAALSYARRMVEEGFFGHLDPQGRGMSDRMKKAGVQARAAGENVASNVSLSRMAERLYESPAHRNNLLRNDFNAVGVAVVRASGSGGSGWIAVQLFADIPVVSKSFPVEDLGEIHPNLWLQVRQNREAEGLPLLVVDPVLNRKAESLVKKAIRENRLDATRLETLTVRAIENDGSHLLKTFALIPLKEQSELRTVYLLNQQSFNLVGGRFLKNADGGLTAFLLLGILDTGNENSVK